MKKLFIFLLVIATPLLAQKRCLITNITHAHIIYDGYDGEQVIATDQKVAIE